MSKGIIEQPYNAKVPYDFSVKFSDKIGQIWVYVMTADGPYNGISLNLVLLTFEDGYHLR